MSDDDKSLVEMVAVILRRGLGREALMLGVFTFAVGSAALYGSHALAQTVAAGIDAGVKANESVIVFVREDLERTKFALRTHVVEEADSRIALHNEMRATQLDLRELYKTVRLGTRSERLENAPGAVDGGP